LRRAAFPVFVIEPDIENDRGIFFRLFDIDLFSMLLRRCLALGLCGAITFDWSCQNDRGLILVLTAA